jgi:hypothetical protein
LLVPFAFLFGAAIKLSAGSEGTGETRIPGGRPTVVAIALLGIAMTVASMVISFVPPPDEERPMLAVLKVAGLTTALLLGGAAVYVVGTLRARRRLVGRHRFRSCVSRLPSQDSRLHDARFRGEQ